VLEYIVYVPFNGSGLIESKTNDDYFFPEVHAFLLPSTLTSDPSHPPQPLFGKFPLLALSRKMVNILPPFNSPSHYKDTDY
jgi:hypothetical protein